MVLILSKVLHLNTVKEIYLNKFYIQQGLVKDQLIFIVKTLSDDLNVAILVCQEIEDLHLTNGHKAIMIVRTWCEKEFRNCGIVTNLYRFLYNELNFALLSDIQQTPETQSIWNKVREYWPVKMISLSSQQIVPIDDKKLYDQDLDYVLIVERKKDLDPSNPFSSAVNQNVNSIVEDYQFNLDGL